MPDVKKSNEAYIDMSAMPDELKLKAINSLMDDFIKDYTGKREHNQAGIVAVCGSNGEIHMQAYGNIKRIVTVLANIIEPSIDKCDYIDAQEKLELYWSLAEHFCKKVMDWSENNET